MDFKSMATDQLHALEFEIYESLPEDDKRELLEIWGVEKTRKYYQERGRRLDQKRVVGLKSKIRDLRVDLREAEARLENGSSGRYHFSIVEGIW